MYPHRYKEGELVAFVDDYIGDEDFVKKNEQGRVQRYDDFLVVVSMPKQVTVCVREAYLKPVVDTSSDTYATFVRVREALLKPAANGLRKRTTNL